MKKEPLKTIHQYHDVTDQFAHLSDDSIHAEVYTLGMLHDKVNDLVTTYGRDAEVAVSLEGDEYSVDWGWTIVTQRLETIDEQKQRLQKEKDRIKAEQKRQKQRDQEEKKLYLKLKKKFENPPIVKQNIKN